MQMSNAEICTSFKQAKNQNDQISILAELNACGTAEILEILQAGGCISGLPKLKREPELVEDGRITWTPEMNRQLIAYCEAGKAPKDIAELMGLRAKQVTDRKCALKRAGYIFDIVETVIKEKPVEGDEENAATAMDKPEERAEVQDIPEEATIPKNGNVEATVDPLDFLYNCLPYGLERISAAVRFVDGRGYAGQAGTAAGKYVN